MQVFKVTIPSLYSLKPTAYSLKAYSLKPKSLQPILRRGHAGFLFELAAEIIDVAEPGYFGDATDVILR